MVNPLTVAVVQGSPEIAGQLAFVNVSMQVWQGI